MITTSRVYYILHSAVYQLDKSTTKWLMVMDASFDTSSELLLNDVLHIGENLQNYLFSILIDYTYLMNLSSLLT